jgi:hypothetical protein
MIPGPEVVHYYYHNVGKCNVSELKRKGPKMKINLKEI